MFPNDFENNSDNAPRAHTSVLWILIPGLALALAGDIYQFRRSAHLASDMAANERNTQLELHKVADSTGAALRLDQQRLDELKDQLNTSAAATLRQARSEVKRYEADVERWDSEVKRLSGLVEKGLTPFACVNTMEWLKIALTDLPQGFEVADKGGVVKLAELQQKGFAYIRP